MKRFNMLPEKLPEKLPDPPPLRVEPVSPGFSRRIVAAAVGLPQRRAPFWRRHGGLAALASPLVPITVIAGLCAFLAGAFLYLGQPALDSSPTAVLTPHPDSPPPDSSVQVEEGEWELPLFAFVSTQHEGETNEETAVDAGDYLLFADAGYSDF